MFDLSNKTSISLLLPYNVHMITMKENVQLFFLERKSYLSVIISESSESNEGYYSMRARSLPSCLVIFVSEFPNQLEEQVLGLLSVFLFRVGPMVSPREVGWVTSARSDILCLPGPLVVLQVKQSH